MSGFCASTHAPGKAGSTCPVCKFPVAKTGVPDGHAVHSPAFVKALEQEVCPAMETFDPDAFAASVIDKAGCPVAPFSPLDNHTPGVVVRFDTDDGVRKRFVKRVRMSGVPLPGELVNVDGYPYRVMERQWGVNDSDPNTYAFLTVRMCGSPVGERPKGTCGRKYTKGGVTVWADQFSATAKACYPWVNPWPDKQGYTPRDCSWGHIDFPSCRRHVQAGDWLVTWPDGTQELVGEDQFGEKAGWKPV